MQLPLLCEKSETILLVLVGLTVGRPAVQQAVQQVGSQMKYLNFSTDRIGRIFTMFKCYYSVTYQSISVNFLGKLYCEVCYTACTRDIISYVPTETDAIFLHVLCTLPIYIT